jgi:hypothetical protein
MLCMKMVPSLHGHPTKFISAGYAHAAVIVGEKSRAKVLMWGTGMPEGACLGKYPTNCCMTVM